MPRKISDTERLDWIQKQRDKDNKYIWGILPIYSNVWGKFQGYRLTDGYCCGVTGKTIRQAIDAAMREEKKR